MALVSGIGRDAAASPVLLEDGVAFLEIDPETGVTKIEKFTAVDDFGNVINPMIVEGQVHGGAEPDAPSGHAQDETGARRPRRCDRN